MKNFRIYDKENKQYLNEPYYKILLANNGVVHNLETDQWYDFGERYALEFSSGVFDKNDKEVYLNDKVKYWSFYNTIGSSEDWFGTEPQNSYRVYEEYLEQVEGSVVFQDGCFYVESKKEKIPLHIITEGLGSQIFEHYLYDYGGDFEGFLEGCEEDMTKRDFETIMTIGINPEHEDMFKSLFNKHTSQLEIVGNSNE